MKDPKNPWKTVSQRIVHQSPFMTVRQDEVIRPDGTPGIYDVMSRSRSNQVIPAAPDGGIYLVGQWRYPTGTYGWELPGGGKNKGGESDLDAAKRELREEGGLISEKWTILGARPLLNGHSDAYFDTFLAEDVVETGINEMADDGIDALQKFSLREVLEMTRSGLIESPPAVTAIHLYCLHRELIKLS